MSYTPLPENTDFIGADVTEGGFKTALTNLRTYLAGLLGETGNPEDANVGGMIAGGIIMWSGAIDNIPEGWALCNGENGTPNLLDRFVIAAGGNYSPGETGNGTIPQHNHSVSLNTNNTGAHTHSIRLGKAEMGGHAGYPLTGATITSSPATKADSVYPVTQSSGAHSHSVSGNTSNTGSGTEVIAKHYALCYIMKL